MIQDWDKYQTIITNDYDQEPDLFHFNFASFSGSLFFKQYNTAGNSYVAAKGIIQKETAYLDVTFYPEDSDHWVIFDGDGFKYYFGTHELSEIYTTQNGFYDNYNESERSYFRERPIQPTVETAWYLDSIVSPQNNKIIFSYEIDKIYSPISASEDVSYWLDGDKEHLTGYGDLSTTLRGEYKYYNYSYAKNEQARLTNISFTGGQVSFNYSDRLDLESANNNTAKKLTSITIKNNNENLRQFTLKQSYLGNTNNPFNCRLMLDSLKIGTNNNMNYVFSYNRNVLPNKKSVSSDYWGYYNNAQVPAENDRAFKLTSHIYTVSRNGAEFFPGLNKKSTETYMKYGILTSIQYPTGGKTNFDYEMHTFQNSFQAYNNNGQEDINSGGGLRIRKIIDIISATDSIQREFTYQYKDGSSTGILMTAPQHHSYYTLKEHTFDLKPGNCVNIFYTVLYVNGFSTPYTPFGNSAMGGNIGYSYVEEKIKANSDNGRITYTFVNQADRLPDLSERIVRGCPSIPNLNNGKPLQIRYLNKDSTVQRKNIFKYVNNNTSSIKGVKVYTLPMLDNNNFYVKFYDIYSERWVLDKKIDSLFVGNTPVVTTENYSYNAYNLPSTTSMLRSDGKKQTTKLVYPFDFTDNAVLNKMTDKHVLSNYVDKIMYVEEEPNDRVIEAEHRKYHEVHPEIFKPERIDLLQQNASLSVNDLYPTINTTIDGLAYVYIQAAASPPHDGEFTIPSGATENETTTVVIAANFKQTVNNSPGFDFTIYTQQTNVVYTVNIQSWHMKMIGNNYVYDETVEIELPPGDYVAKLSGYSTDSNVHYDGNFCISFSKQTSTMVPQYSLFKPEIYYQYDTKGNVIEFKPAGSNVPTTYLWGYKYQYPIAKIENATYEQVRTALTDQAAVDAIANSDTLLNTQLDALNNLRTNPSLPNAMVTTYTYKPLVGLQTVTDPRGVTITYEYDSFGRLQAIKDENGKTIENYNYHYKN